MDTQTTVTTTTPCAFTEIQGNPSIAAPNSEKPGGLRIDQGLFVWLIFLALGGGILALYYSQIGYLPDIEWRSLLVYLAAATILGASLGILFSLLLFLPGCIWAELIISDRPLYRTFYPDGEPCTLEIISRLGVLFGAILLATHFLLPMGLLTYGIGTFILLVLSGIIMWLSFQKDSRLGLISGILLLLYQPLLILGKTTYLRAAPVFFVATPLIILVFIRKYPPNQSNHPPLTTSQVFKYAFWFAISVVLSQASMLLTYYLAGKPTEASYYQLTVFCTSIVIVSNHIVAARYCHHRKQAILASLVAAFLILCAADHYTSLSQRIMAFYGFGGGRPVSMLLNEDGARIIDHLGLSESFREGQPRTRICNVELLSTVGTECFLSYRGINFTLPKSVIISWSAIDPRKDYGNRSPCDGDGLTTTR